MSVSGILGGNGLGLRNLLLSRLPHGTAACSYGLRYTILIPIAVGVFLKAVSLSHTPTDIAAKRW